ncbi:MAG TPA: sialidase family protein [Humibacillus sp.]|nr:sialidase family protein [Humibacillus sp.]
MRKFVVPLAVTASVAAAGLLTGGAASAAAPTYDITTLAGKVASVRGTAGLQIRFSAYIEEEAVDGPFTGAAAPPISPSFVLSSPLDGTSVSGPAVTVNRDTAAAPQNETAIAVDPTNPNRIVAGANDYVTRTWSCDISGTPCSALGDGYSGTFFSTDGGATWQGQSSDPAHLGTLIPGVTHLAGGPYDAGGDPALTFDSRGDAYYAGLGFDRAAPPNTVAVNRGTFGGSGLSWSAPTFINPTTSPSVLNDKEWIAADAHTSSPFRDRIYVTWTRFLFNPRTGAYVQSPIFFASSSDHGHTFTTPTSISGNVLYDQGSRPVVGPDGSLYVFFEGSTRLASTDSTYVVKSTDGGASWGKPVKIADVVDSEPLADTVFRVNSYPAAAAAPDGRLYATWTSVIDDASTALYSTSSDGGATWSAPQRVFAAASRDAVGYPVNQPGGGTLNAPSPTGPVEDIFPAVGVGPDGQVHLAAYRGEVVSPWQECASAPPPPVGRISCDTLGDYIHNTRLDYVVTDLTATQLLSTHPINTRYGFGGGFFGDYTDLAVGGDGRTHALWTDSNNVQTVEWFYGAQFVPTQIHQQDVVVRSGNL